MSSLTHVFDTTYQKPTNKFRHGQRVIVEAAGRRPAMCGVAYSVHGRNGNHWYSVGTSHEGQTAVYACHEEQLTPEETVCDSDFR